MEVTRIVTDGKARTTGKLMYQVVEQYYLDMAPYASLSLPSIFNIIKRLPYRPDPDNLETLMRPSYTMTMRGSGGDCLSEDTQILSASGLKKISAVKRGDIIMGKEGWTEVLKIIDKGILPVKKYLLDNGGEILATEDHLFILQDGYETKGSDLKPDDCLLQPAYIPDQGSCRLSNDDCRFIGLYLSDGWIDGNRVCISGKDGFPKESQKHWTVNYATLKGWKTSWHPRYVRVYVPKNDPVLKFMSANTAIDKYFDSSALVSLNSEQSYSLLDGLLSDSHQPHDRRSGKTFSSISRSLVFAVVLLYRKLGIGCGIRYIRNHGGLGTNPIWRVYPRLYRSKSAKILKIENIGVRHCFDLETKDHGIYLPEADVIVHNCDDKAIALASWARLHSIPFRFLAIRRNGRKTLHHVALELYINNGWIYCDPTYSFNTLGRQREEAERVIL